MADAVESFLVETLLELLVEEGDLLRGLEDEVKYIKRELRLMRAFFVHVGSLRGLSDEVNDLMEEMVNLVQDAQDFIDRFNKRRSERRRWPRWGILERYELFSLNNLKDRLTVAKKVMQIKQEIYAVSEKAYLLDIGYVGGSQMTSSAIQALQPGGQSSTGECTEITVLDEENKEVMSNTNTIVSSAVEKLDALGAESLVQTRTKGQVIRIQEKFKHLQGLLKGVEEDERGKAWKEELCDISRFVEAVTESFMKKRRDSPAACPAILNKLISTLKRFQSECWLHKEIRRVDIRIEDACRRTWTYGIGDIEGRKGSSLTVSRTSDVVPDQLHRSIEEGPLSFLLLHMLAPLNYSVESIRRDLKLMYAFHRDIESMEDLDERVKVWLEDIKEIVPDVEALVKNADKMEKIQWGNIFQTPASVLKYFLVGNKVFKGIRRINYKIRDISERKWTYDIGSIKGRNGLRSMARATEEGEPSSSNANQTSVSINSGELQPEEGEPSSSNANQTSVRIDWVEMVTILASILPSQQSVIQYKGHVKWLKKEQKLMNAFFKCVPAMEELDERAKIWVEELKVVNDEVNITNTNADSIQQKGNGIFKILGGRSKVVREIRQIKKQISSLSRSKIVYGIRNIVKEEKPKCVVHDQPDEDQTPPLETIDMIYKDLPITLRRCLSYFRLFAAEYKIPARRLILLWVAEGMVHQREDDQELPEYVAEGYLTELINRNLVQVTERKLDGKVRTCSIPNALWKQAKKVNSLPDHTETSSNSSLSIGSITRLVDHLDSRDPSFDHIHGDNIMTSTSLHSFYKNVSSFLSFDTREGDKPGEDIGNFLQRCISSRPFDLARVFRPNFLMPRVLDQPCFPMPQVLDLELVFRPKLPCFLMLRVLDLERVFRPKLPKALGKLDNLKYLGLRWTYLETLPSFISNFLKLQTLDLKHTYISTLPSSIWKMQQLRHLYLSEGYRSRFVPRPSGGSLEDLQTLWGVFVDEESPVKGGLDRLINLRKLGLASRLMLSQRKVMLSQIDAIADWILKLEHLQSLRLRSYDELGQPWFLPLKPLSGHATISTMYLLGRLKIRFVMSGLPQGLTDLTLSASGLKKDPMQTLKCLPKLRVLRLLSKSYKGKNMLCSSGGFPQLRVLKLWKLEKLEEWNVNEGALPDLRDLEIRSCTSLKMLPVGLRHIRTLQELKLGDMPEEFTARVQENEGQYWGKIKHVRTQKNDDLILQRSMLSRTLAVSGIPASHGRP